MKQVICQKWTESDSWSGPSDDGYSLHLTDRDRLKFICEYNKTLPDAVPECYSYANRFYSIEVDEEVYAKVAAGKFGLRFYTKAPPDPEI